MDATDMLSKRVNTFANNTTISIQAIRSFTGLFLIKEANCMKKI